MRFMRYTSDMPDPPWKPTERQLRRYARVHLAYEVKVLHGQIAWLALVGGPRLTDLHDLSYFEAALVHLRLLDDFFLATPRGDDVVASHYLPTWRPRGFLREPERRRINGQVAHLAGRRSRPIHNLGSMARRCSKRFEFLRSQMESAQPNVRARMEALEETFDWARELGELTDQATGVGSASDLAVGS